jgi:hypothetical protein
MMAHADNPPLGRPGLGERARIERDDAVENLIDRANMALA